MAKPVSNGPPPAFPGPTDEEYRKAVQTLDHERLWNCIRSMTEYLVLQARRYHDTGLPVDGFQELVDDLSGLCQVVYAIEYPRVVANCNRPAPDFRRTQARRRRTPR